MRTGLTARLLIAGAGLAVVVAGVFALLVVAVHDLRQANRAARGSEAAVVAASATEKLVLDLETGLRGYQITTQRSFLAPYLNARSALPAQIAALEGLVGDDGLQERRARAIAAQVRAYVADYARPLIAGLRPTTPDAQLDAATAEGRRRTNALRAQFDALSGRARRRAGAAQARVGGEADRAIAFGIGGLIGSALLIVVFAGYLARAIVVPVRRMAGAAGRLAGGDLSARVVRGGRGEVADLAAAFNAMAVVLQANRDELESQNAELAAQQAELEQAMDELALEKGQVETFNRFGQRLAAELQVGRLAEVILAELAERAGAELGALYGVDDGDEDELALLATRGLDRRRLPARLRPGDGLPGRALAERRSVRGDLGEAGLRLTGLGAEVTARHELHVPLVQGNQVLAVLTLARVADRAYTAEEVGTIEYLAGQAALALANAVALRRARERALIVRAALDATPSAIALFAPDGRPVLESRPMRELRDRLSESSPAELIGAAVDDPQTETVDQLELPGSPAAFVRYTAPVHDDSGLLLGRIVVLRDVTVEREAERFKDEFFALVSHELRTPLTSIMGYLELVLDEDALEPAVALAPEQRRFLEVVERNARRLLRLVGDLLFVAQVEAGTLALEPAPLDLVELVEESVEAARPRAVERGIALDVAIATVGPLTGDRDRLGQVLDNLISNALKFTPEEGAVQVRVSRRDGHALVQVHDTGVGIPTAEQDRLFDRFYRASTATRRAIPGVGLGLAIVKAIVEGHGGGVTVSSVVGAGTTFSVALPLATGPQASIPPGE